MAIYQLIRTLSLDPEEVEKLTTAYEDVQSNRSYHDSYRRAYY